MSEAFKENILDTRNVGDLSGFNFLIPSYQRGFKWTERQVVDLLNDIDLFNSKPASGSDTNPWYCLQPVVVRECTEEKKKKLGFKGVWHEVIDGQQRLTTIFLLLHYANEMWTGKQKNKIFRIKYETRTESEAFLNKLEVSKDDDVVIDISNPDFYHISNAYKVIHSWVKEYEKENNRQFDNHDFQSNLKFHVRVIWYEVLNGTDPIDIFTRLNIGKIPLTNAELIKALLLRKGNFEKERASLKQIQIASEWDEIERKLHQPEFWYFIYDIKNPIKYENRIEYIFDLLYGRGIEHADQYTFDRFNADAEESKAETGTISIDGLWLKVKRFFLTFEEWYGNRDLYHLIGYLVECGVNISVLKDAAAAKSKKEFKQFLFSQIRSQVDFRIEDLVYGADSKKIRKVLLLFNIQTLSINTGADVRFPFHRYKTQNWDIEHVRSQTDKEFHKNSDKEKWMQDIVDYFTGYSIEKLSGLEDDESARVLDALNEQPRALCNRLIKAFYTESLDDNTFKTIRADVETYFRERSTEDGSETENTDSIGNLALLDEETNRSYKNAPFPIKRKRIIENDRVGKFVPICTKNVFLKYYSSQLDDLMYWQERDAKAYFQAISTTLQSYLPTTKSES